MTMVLTLRAAGGPAGTDTVPHSGSTAPTPSAERQTQL